MRMPPFDYQPGFICTECGLPAADGCKWCGIGRCKRHRYQHHAKCDHPRPAPTPRRRK